MGIFRSHFGGNGGNMQMVCMAVFIPEVLFWTCQVEMKSKDAGKRAYMLGKLSPSI